MSAMAGQTNHLIALTEQAAGTPLSDTALAEQDYVVSTGEQVTVSLLGLALLEEALGESFLFVRYLAIFYLCWFG